MKISRLLIVMMLLLVFSGLLTSSLVKASLTGDLGPTSRFQGISLSSSNTDQAQATSINQRVVARIYVKDRGELDAIANSLDIWEAHPDGMYIVAELSLADYQRLEALGYRLEIDAEKTAKVNNPLAVLDPRYYYFDTDFTNLNGLYILDFLQAMNSQYSGLVELIDIGDAWQSYHGGHHRDMWVLRITNEDPAYGPIEAKPAFFLFADIHAREVVTSELAIRYIKYLTTGYNGEGGYGIDPDVTWLVNHNIAYVLITQNPDGHRVDEANTNAYRRKNLDNDDGCSDPASLGVDLNRNSSFLWGCCGGSSGYACDETYRGPSAGSEPETAAFQAYFATIIPDQNGPNGDNEIPPAAPDDTTGIFISLHSYSDLVLWPWGFNNYGPPPNNAQLTVIGRKFAYYNGYDPSGSIWYTTDGTTDNWTYGKFGVPSYTIEVGPSGGSCSDFFPPYGCIDGTDGMPRNFWGENKPVLIYALKIARTPYRTAYGPDTSDLTVNPAVVAPGDPVQLSALVADHRYPGDPLQPVAGAEYFIDNPGLDGTGTPMIPTDGSWGGTSETVNLVVDSSGIAQGRHYLLIHGQNESGQWGPFTAIFLYVMEPGVAPVIEGYVRDAATNGPLEATITAGSFEAASDPGTGFYSMMVISGTYDVSVTAAGHRDASVPNVIAQDYTITWQDFYLDPLCVAFSDDVENGIHGWSVQYPWAITTEDSHSPDHSWTESPGGNYSNNRNTAITSPVLDLTDYTNVTLNFWHTYDTEPDRDYAYVEYSTNGGGSWTQAKAYTGYGPHPWGGEIISLPALDGIANARFRFRFTSNSTITADGWHVDDFTLLGSTPTCITPLAPVAAFSSDSPVTLGEAMHFTDQTYGTPPLDYAWDFGDGIGSSTLANPAYTYTAYGVYTVTLAVTNTQGSDNFNQAVVVRSVEDTPFTSVAMSLVTAGTLYQDQVTSFKADLSPDWATVPFSYTLDFDDATAPVSGAGELEPFLVTHTFTTPGTFTPELSVWNRAMTLPVTSTLPVTIHPVYIDLTAVDLTLVTVGTVYSGSLVAFNLDFAPDNASKPFTYTLDFGDGGLPFTDATSLDSLPITYTYTLTGSFTVSVTAWNGVMTAPVTDTVSLNVYPPNVCVGLTQVTILGPTMGVPGIYTFTTTYQPRDASLPITYTWDNGDLLPVSMRTLPDPGTYTLTVSASNCPAVQVDDTHTIDILLPSQKVYLPLIATGH